MGYYSGSVEIFVFMLCFQSRFTVIYGSFFFFASKTCTRKALKYKNRRGSPVIIIVITFVNSYESRRFFISSGVKRGRFEAFLCVFLF